MSESLTYRTPGAACSSQYLWGPVLEEVQRIVPRGASIFDLGCGNGAFGYELTRRGYSVCGVDSSESGIAIATSQLPEADFRVGSAYDDLSREFGRFPCVVSLEVIEHCYDPRRFARTVLDLLEPGGVGIISTPYHGYLKNLLLSLFGKWDAHMSPLWDGGHIKLFSERTLGLLLEESGLEVARIRRCGRFGPLAKSMFAIAKRSSDPPGFSNATAPAGDDTNG